MEKTESIQPEEDIRSVNRPCIASAMKNCGDIVLIQPRDHRSNKYVR